jgi:hypothetical protein
MHDLRRREIPVIHLSQPKVATHCKADIYNFTESLESWLTSGNISQLERHYGSQRVVDWLTVV